MNKKGGTGVPPVIEFGQAGRLSHGGCGRAWAKNKNKKGGTGVPPVSGFSTGGTPVPPGTERYQRPCGGDCQSARAREAAPSKDCHPNVTKLRLRIH